MRGTTLLELIVTLAIGATLLALAAPGLARLIAGNRLTAQVNRFVATVHYARNEAIKQHLDVVLCRSGDGTRCEYDDVGWHGGWLVFVDETPSDPPQVQPGDRVLRIEAGLTGTLATANRPAFVFRALGRRATNGTVVFCARGRDIARAVIVNPLGRPRASLTRADGGALVCPP